jgi:hypothetical protein
MGFSIEFIETDPDKILADRYSFSTVLLSPTHHPGDILKEPGDFQVDPGASWIHSGSIPWESGGFSSYTFVSLQKPQAIRQAPEAFQILIQALLQEP